MSITDRNVPVSMQLYSALLHAFPIVKSGVTRLSFNAVTNRMFANCSEPVMARLLNGAQIEVAPNDHDGRVLYLFGTNDPKVQSTAQGLSRKGDVFLDIGANYSTIGLAVAEHLGPAGVVHLFEPQEQICRRVDKSIADMRLANVVLHRMALMDRDGEMRLSRPKDHSGMATLVDYGKADRVDWEGEVVVARDIASYVGPLVDGHEFGAKLDVEGAEPMLMSWLLAQPGLQFLIFEAARNQALLFDQVRSAGFHLYGLCKNVFRTRLRLISSMPEMSAHHDLVAVRISGSRPVPKYTNPHSLGRLVRR
jgi:FkbM family methyltransferase